jgi:Mg2+ and Co2+ transporter CorA
MIALKCHLFASEAMEASLSQTQSASHLHVDYGRSLHPSIMNHDAFYNLTELFSFTASSHIEFLNLIDIKLDKYTSQPQAWEFQSLPHLKYTKGILYRHIQKTQRILESVKNARYPTWPKDETESGSRKAAISAQSLEQDFKHLLDRAVALHTRTTEAITVLMSSISISESQRAIDQAQRVEKLTFLAFIFVPLSFTTGLFGMNVTEIEGGKLSLTWWAVVSLPVMGMAIFLFYFDVGGLARRFWKGWKEWYTGNTNNKRVF